jgi:hypothetical protein
MQQVTQAEFNAKLQEVQELMLAAQRELIFTKQVRLRDGRIERGEWGYHWDGRAVYLFCQQNAFTPEAKYYMNLDGIQTLFGRTGHMFT